MQTWRRGPRVIPECRTRSPGALPECRPRGPRATSECRLEDMKLFQNADLEDPEIFQNADPEDLELLQNEDQGLRGGECERKGWGQSKSEKLHFLLRRSLTRRECKRLRRDNEKLLEGPFSGHRTCQRTKYWAGEVRNHNCPDILGHIFSILPNIRKLPKAVSRSKGLASNQHQISQWQSFILELIGSTFSKYLGKNYSKPEILYTTGLEFKLKGKGKMFPDNQGLRSYQPDP